MATESDKAASTRERLLDAAYRVIAREGIGGLSVRAVAKEADVYLAAVYYHFGTKEDLLTALMRRLYDTSLGAGVAAAESVPPGPSRVRYILEGWLEYWKVESDLIYYETLSDATRHDERLEYLRSYYAAWTDQLVELLRDDNAWDEDQLRGVAVLLRLLTDGIGIDRIVQESDADRQLAVSVFEGLVRSLFEYHDRTSESS